MSDIYPDYKIEDPTDIRWDLIHDIVCIIEPADTNWVRYNFEGKGVWVFHRGTEVMTIERECPTRHSCFLNCTYADQNPEGLDKIVQWTSMPFSKDNILHFNHALREFWELVRARMILWNENH